MVTRMVFICLFQVNTYRGLVRYPRWCSTTTSGHFSIFNFLCYRSIRNGQIGTLGEEINFAQTGRAFSMADNDLLNGWKAIADYLDVNPKTARRWENSDALPIFRPERRRKGPVLAKKSALDAWIQGSLEKTVLEDKRLVALGRSDRILWTHVFPEPLRPFTREELEWRVQRVDLHGNGDRGVLVTARFLAPGSPDAMYYFSPAGKLEWTLEAYPPLLDRNNTSFEKAWTFKHLTVTPASKGTTVWIALAHEAGWAGCVLRVNPLGAATVQLANAGYVERLCPVSSGDEACLVVCGENNAFDQSFVGLLGINDPPCSSPPGGRPRYQYANAPAGNPRKYILFPRTELIIACQRPYGHASRMRQYPGHIIVEVETGGDGGFFLYHFSERLEPKYVFPSGDHEFWHRDLELAGRIHHTWDACPELDGPLALKVWEPDAGWHDEAMRWRDNPWRDNPWRDK